MYEVDCKCTRTLTGEIIVFISSIVRLEALSYDLSRLYSPVGARIRHVVECFDRWTWLFLYFLPSYLTRMARQDRVRASDHQLPLPTHLTGTLPVTTGA